MKRATPAAGTAQYDYPSLLAIIALPACVFYWGLASSWFPFLPSDQTTCVAVGFGLLAILFALRFRSFVTLLTASPLRFAMQLFVVFLLVVLFSIIANMLSPGQVDMSLSLRHFEMTLPSFAPMVILAGGASFASVRQSFVTGRLIVAALTVIPTLSFLFPSLAIGEIQGIESGAIRSFGVFGDTAAFYISFFAFSFLRTRSLIPFAISLFALLTTGSITALLVFVAATVYETVRQTLDGSKTAPYALVGGALLVLLGVSGGLEAIVNDLSSTIGFANPLQRLASTSIESSERYYSSLQGLAYWNDAVWLGHGYNSYFQLASTGDLMRGANPSNALNQGVQTLVDCGVIGLFALVSFFWAALVAVPRRGNTDEFGVRTWLMMLILLNHSAVYILPMYHFTAFLFGLLGYSLRASAASVTQARGGARITMPTDPYAIPGATASLGRLERNAD